MKIILATGNSGKVKEIKEIFKEYEIIPYTKLIDAQEIVEDGKTFKDNAIIKSETIYKLLNDDNTIVLADDSGISIKALDNRPNIFSARYAGKNANDKDNLQKVINELKEKKIPTSPAFYTAAIALTLKQGTFTTHGWMYGDVIDEARGDRGFGYDPIFIPENYSQTLGELDISIKQKLSHRYKALMLAKKLIKTLKS